MKEILILVSFAMMLFLLCIFMFSKTSVSKKLGGKALFAVAVVILVFSFIFEPQNFIRWDLIEHFKILDSMRSGGLNYARTESQYADLFVYNYFAYFVSLLPESLKNLLTTIPLMIDFLIVGYIYKRVFDEHFTETTGQTRILAVILWLSTFGLKLAISGIRCSLAVSIVALAIYLEMIEKRKRKLSILLYVIAIFIHNFALFLIAVRLLAMLKKPVLIMLSALGISMVLEPLSKYLMYNINNEYLKFSFGRVVDTTDDMSFMNILDSDSGSVVIIHICFVVFSLYLFTVATKESQIHQEDGYCSRVVSFASTVGAIAIGLSFNYLYLERFMYLLSFALLMILPIHNKSKKEMTFEKIVILPLALFLLFFYNMYAFIVNYTGNYFLSF